MQKRTTPAPTMPVNPTLHYFLMVGSWPEFRCRGWVAAAIERDEDATVRAYWAQYEPAIRASVAEAGVEPWAVTHRRPRGPRFDEWLRAFRGQHEY